MVEVKNNRTGEELLQELKAVLVEVHKKHPISIEGYIQYGEHKLKSIKGFYRNAIECLGEFGKLIFGCAWCEIDNAFVSYYVPEDREYVFVPQGDLDFSKIDEIALADLSNVDANILDSLGRISHNSYSSRAVTKFFGENLGHRLLGYIVYSYYLSFMEGFEKSVNENPDYAPFRALLHRFPREEKVLGVPYPYCYNNNSKYRYECDLERGVSEITPEEYHFVELAMKILRQKILAFYDRVKDENLTDEQLEERAKVEAFNIFSIPYVGFFDSLDSIEAYYQFSAIYAGEELSQDEEKFVRRLYTMFKKNLRNERKERLQVEQQLANKVHVLVKESFDSCETIEQKLALARAYALEGKSRVVVDGRELVRILGITPFENMPYERRILYHYIMAMYYARPTLPHITHSDDGYYSIDLDNDPGLNIRYCMYKAGEHRRQFEDLCKHMGINITPLFGDTLVIRADTNDVLDEIVAVMTIQREGGVKGIRKREPVRCYGVESLDGTIIGYSTF